MRLATVNQSVTCIFFHIYLADYLLKAASQSILSAFEFNIWYTAKALPKGG